MIRWMENNWPNVTKPEAEVVPEDGGRRVVVVPPVLVPDGQDGEWILVTRRRNR